MTEWCVMRIQRSDGVAVHHRGPWTKSQCQEWIDEFVNDGGNPEVFVLGSREVTDWTVAK